METKLLFLNFFVNSAARVFVSTDIKPFPPKIVTFAEIINGCFTTIQELLNYEIQLSIDHLFRLYFFSSR
jgi:hypothetical protein